jgi:hypothetical protein
MFAGMLTHYWIEIININTELANEYGSIWSERLLEVLTAKLQSFERLDATSSG